MKATELMINDWVLIKDYPIKASPQKVKPEHFVRSLVEFEPIPLTAEILKKNGFKHYITEEDSDSFEYSEGNFSYCFNRTADGYMSCIDVTGSFTISGLIKYVHELQHILRLCGLSKLADNFKI